MGFAVSKIDLKGIEVKEPQPKADKLQPREANRLRKRGFAPYPENVGPVVPAAKSTGRLLKEACKPAKRTPPKRSKLKWEPVLRRRPGATAGMVDEVQKFAASGRGDVGSGNSYGRTGVEEQAAEGMDPTEAMLLRAVFGE